MKFRMLMVFLFSAHFINAQKDSLHKVILDSLRKEFQKDSAHTYRPKKFRALLAYDSRNSFISRAPVNLYGVQLGISYMDKHTVGIGGYRITQNSSQQIRKRDVSNRMQNEQLIINYGTLFYQYAIIDKRFFEFDIPFEVGFGKANIIEKDANTDLLISNRNVHIFPLGLGLQFIVKPIKWVGISFMGGYRYVQDNEDRLNFNGWYYSVGIWLEFRQIVRDTKFYGFQRRHYRKKVALYQK